MRASVCMLLLLLGLSGAALSGGEVKKNRLKISLEEAYRAWHKGFSSDKKEEREKALRSMFFATKKDIEYLFPKHVEKLWPLIEKSNAEMLGALEDVTKEMTGKGPIKSIEPIDVRTDKEFSKLYKRLIELVPKDVELREIRVTREDGGGGGGTYLYLHNRWLFIKDLYVVPEFLDKLK